MKYRIFVYSGKWYYDMKCLFGSVSYIYFFYLLSLSSVRSELQPCHPGLTTHGWTVPTGDINVEYGESLKIFCILNRTSTKGQNASDIIFYRNGERLSNEYVSVLNETTSLLYIRSPSPAEDMYYCRLRTTEKHILNGLSSLEISSSSQISEYNEELVCLNTVAVGTKPAKAENITCISYNWEKLICNWTSSFNHIKTTYRASYYPPGRGGRTVLYHCPTDDDKLYNNCTWTLNTNPIYRHAFDFLYIVVDGTNVFGNSSNMIKFNNFAHMIPSAPLALEVLNKTVSSVSLQWYIGTLSEFTKGLVYKIEYTWINSNKWNVVVYNQSQVTKNENKVFVNVTGLPYPNIAYDFRVYMKSSIAIGNNVWSEPSTLIVKTKSCAPYWPPTADVGSFEISHVYATQRDIYVYWSSLLTYEQNGENFHYNAYIVEDGNSFIHRPNNTTNAYAKFTGLSLNSYRFYISSVNKDGSSAASELFIPRDYDVIDVPALFTKTDLGDGLYALSWQPSRQWKNITNFTVFWCDSDRDRPYRCEGHLEWTYFSPNVSQCNVKVDAKKTFQFAIAANSLYSSSGMAWALCTILHDKVGKMKNVWVNKIGRNFIEVGWRLECSERVQGIEGYYLYYCPVSVDDNVCTKPERNITITGDSSIVRGNITNLTPYTRYRIVTAAFTKDNGIGPRSDELFNRTLETAPDTTGSSITDVKTTNTSVVLSWTAPRVMNGILKYYDVQLNNVTAIKTKETTFTLIDLKSYSSYIISVFACTTECSLIGKTDVRTDIGIPGIVQDLTVHQINSSFVLVSWKPPQEKSGPFVVYEVDVLPDESIRRKINRVPLKTIDTKMEVAIPNCKDESYQNSSYKFNVRAKTVNNVTGLLKVENHGGWSGTYTFSCFNAEQVSLTYKLSLCFLLIVCIVASILVGRSSMYKCRKMKEVQIILPPSFTVQPSLFESSTMKDNNYHISINRWNKNELDRLNSKLSSETDYEDDIDNTTLDIIDRDENYDADPYSSGCCTGRSSTASSITGATQTSSDSGTEMEVKIDRSSALLDAEIENPSQRSKSDDVNNDALLLAPSGIKWDLEQYVPSSESWRNCYKPILNISDINNKPALGYVTLQHFSAVPIDDREKNQSNVVQSNGYVSVIPKNALDSNAEVKDDFPSGYSRVVNI